MLSSPVREGVFPTLILASRMGRPEQTPVPHERWGLASMVGRFVEISSGEATALLTVSIGLIRQAQERSEPSIWITAGDSTFYPPDVSESGVDLEALPVVRVPTVVDGARAADILLRSGGVALIILDLMSRYRAERPGQAGQAGQGVTHPASIRVQNRVHQGAAVSQTARYAEDRWTRGTRPMPRSDSDRSLSAGIQTRLAALTKKHRATLVCLTQKGRDTSSLGSLVSLRAVGGIRKTSFDRFLWELEVLKDKHHVPGWSHSEACRGPLGLY